MRQIILNHDNPKQAIEAIKKELEFRSALQYAWQSSDGSINALSELATKHLFNILDKLEKETKNSNQIKEKE